MSWSCSSVTEMEKWMEDIKMAIDLAEASNGLSCDQPARCLTDGSKYPTLWGWGPWGVPLGVGSWAWGPGRVPLGLGPWGLAPGGLAPGGGALRKGP